MTSHPLCALQLLVESRCTKPSAGLWDPSPHCALVDTRCIITLPISDSATKPWIRSGHCLPGGWSAYTNLCFATAHQKCAAALMIAPQNHLPVTLLNVKFPWLEISLPHSIRYSNKAEQKADWQAGHRKECAALKVWPKTEMLGTNELLPTLICARLLWRG